MNLADHRQVDHSISLDLLRLVQVGSARKRQLHYVARHESHRPGSAQPVRGHGTDGRRLTGTNENKSEPESGSEQALAWIERASGGALALRFDLGRSELISVSILWDHSGGAWGSWLIG